MKKSNKIEKSIQYLIGSLAMLLVLVSCEKTENVDSTAFTLYYLSMTDIGPSMTGVITAPSYIGGEPRDFKITGITLDEGAYSDGGFEIDKENGSVSLRETSDMPIGVYKLTISCSSNGTQYEFKDALAVNMMKSVPDGIAVTPSKLTVSYADVIDPKSTIELPTAQVKTENDHVSIRTYEIARSDFSSYFAISSIGEISVVRGDTGISPGKYMLSLKLTTGASGEDEGIFENAIEIDVTSEPLVLTFIPAEGKMEEESALVEETTYRSMEPILKGSVEGVHYSITNVEPATDKIEIDAQTGVISVSKNHGFTAGQTYVVSVNVKNVYSAEGVDFDDVFTLEVAEFIEPIEHFTYEHVDAVQAIAFEVRPGDDFKGDEVRFEFIDLPEALQGNLSIDHTGNVSAPEGNTIPIGEYIITVKASNQKSDEANPTITSFNLTVRTNPNYFTYVRYGNNLGLSPIENYANQFRVIGTDYSSVKPIPVTDANVSLTYSIRNIYQAGSVSINSSTGELTIGSLATANFVGAVMVTATAGQGTPEEYAIQTPVFFVRSEPVLRNGMNVRVDFAPFALQINPNSGGRFPAPNVTGVSDMSKFTLDYRGSFQYRNLFGPGTHINGAPNTANSFMQHLFTAYAQSRGINPNYGARAPMSYYDNENFLHHALAYIDANTLEVVINPNKWIHDGVPANGMLVGQLRFGVDGEDPVSSSQISSLALWFDTKF